LNKCGAKPEKDDTSATLWHWTISIGQPPPKETVRYMFHSDWVTLHKICTGKSPLAGDLKSKLRGTLPNGIPPVTSTSAVSPPAHFRTARQESCPSSGRSVAFDVGEMS